MSLDQIQVTPLVQIQTLGGNVLHAMKDSDVGYVGFGEAYMSWVKHGVVKAWKRHTRMTMNLVVPVGSVRFVFFYEGSLIPREEVVGKACYSRITVPPGIWFGFQGLEAPQSLVLNLSNIPHDPQEVERRALSEIKYNWNA